MWVHLELQGGTDLRNVSILPQEGPRKTVYGKPTMKQCSKCGERKPLTEFYNTKKGTHSWCKQCINKRATRYYEENREAILERKHSIHLGRKSLVVDILGGACAYCGFADLRALQIDHINNDGYLTRRKHGRTSTKTIMKYIIEHPEEAKKRYQVLCANCNTIKAYEHLQHPDQPYIQPHQGEPPRYAHSNL